MAKGDGNFKWYWGHGSQPEIYHGACDSRDEVIAAARADDAHLDGFSIVYADKALATPSFDAYRVLEQFEEDNEECWGEDGAEIEATSEDKHDLERRLNEAFNAWASERGIKWKNWSFYDMQNEEFIEPAKADA